MLIEFNIKNFLSINDEISLSLIASPDKLHDENLIECSTLKNDKLLKSAVIYGANASGKTNVLSALNMMQRLVLNSHNFQKGDMLPYQPFKLNAENTKQPTCFRIIFIKNETKYIYGFSYDQENIIDEYLFHYPKGRKKLIFKRDKIDHFSFTEDIKDQTFISNKTPNNILYLSRSTQLNYEKTSEAYDWFKDCLRVVGPADHPIFRDFTGKKITDLDFKKKVMDALTIADLGIDDISSEVVDFSKENLPKDMPEKLKKVMLKNNLRGQQLRITSLHNGVEFNFDEEESEGTQRLFSLIGPIIDTLENGRILVLDELDTKLHHLLNEFIIKLFNNKKNNKGAQIVFTTHNTNLLDLKLFRRDQIWFTEKDPKRGHTDLFSLLEYHPRNDVNIQKGYLAGRYGALPFIQSNRFYP